MTVLPNPAKMEDVVVTVWTITLVPALLVTLDGTAALVRMTVFCTRDAESIWDELTWANMRSYIRLVLRLIFQYKDLHKTYHWSLI